MFLARLVAPFAFACTLAACTSSSSSESFCNSFSLLSPVVTVTDATNGLSLCTATFTLAGDARGDADGGDVVFASVVTTTAGCTYTLTLTPGSHAIEISAAGFGSATVDPFVVQEVPCDTPRPVVPPVTVALAPASG